MGVALATTVVFLFCSADAAERYLPTSVTVAQILERSRNSAGFFPPGGYRMDARSVSANGDVWTATTIWNGGDYRTTVKQGSFTWAYGTFRGNRWRQDVNGMIFSSTNLFAESDPFAIAFRKPSDSTDGVKVLGLTDDAVPSLVVEARPSAGLVERRFYDPTTYLLSRVEVTDYDGHHQVWNYGDYHSVFGRTVAHSIDYESDGATVTLTTRILDYNTVPLTGADFAPPASRALFDLGNRDKVTLPARFTDDGIIVGVAIAGRGLDFILDSGSSDLLVDRSVARELGMVSSGALRESFAGDFTLANARAADFSVAGLSARNVAFSTARFQEQYPGQRVVGLLGTDFIASGALEVNFEKQTLTLYRSVPADLNASGWSALPLRLDYAVPIVSAAYSGLPGLFVADLGAVESTLFPHYFAKFPNRVPAGTADQGELVTLGGKPFGIKHITMKNLILGDWVFGSVQVVVPSVTYAQQRGYDGLIGRDTLSNFNLIFDYSNDKLWFKPIAGETKS